MSADNAIVILGYISETVKEGDFYIPVEPYKVYKVAHVQAWDNFEWYKKNQPYNVGWYLNEVFKESKVFTYFDVAVSEAQRLEEEIGYVEYGVVFEETDYILPELN